MQLPGLLFLVVITFSFEGVASLECWNCLGQDCDGAMAFSNFAYKQKCEEGAACMKTVNYFYNLDTNETSREPPIRSCSFKQGCAASTDAELESCRKDLKLFTSFGCQARFCCEGHLCNGSPTSFTLHPLILFGISIQLRFFLF